MTMVTFKISGNLPVVNEQFTKFDKIEDSIPETSVEINGRMEPISHVFFFYDLIIDTILHGSAVKYANEMDPHCLGECLFQLFSDGGKITLEGLDNR